MPTAAPAPSGIPSVSPQRSPSQVQRKSTSDFFEAHIREIVRSEIAKSTAASFDPKPLKDTVDALAKNMRHVTAARTLDAKTVTALTARVDAWDHAAELQKLALDAAIIRIEVLEAAEAARAEKDKEVDALLNALDASVTSLRELVTATDEDLKARVAAAEAGTAAVAAQQSTHAGPAGVDTATVHKLIADAKEHVNADVATASTRPPTTLTRPSTPWRQPSVVTSPRRPRSKWKVFLPWWPKQMKL